MPEPLFLTAAPPPPGTLIVDCARTDGAETWSHWPQAPLLPEAWRADTSTGQVLRVLATDPAQPDSFAWVANDHIDADGVLAVACACRGVAVLEHANLLEDAAECGDFGAFHGEAALRLCWRLHQLIIQERVRGADWERRCLTRVTDTLPALIAEAAQSDPVRDEAWVNVVAARERLRTRTDVAIEHLGDLVSIAWTRDIGHAWDQFLGVPTADDWPVWAFAGHWGDTCFRLGAERVTNGPHPGTMYVLEAPGHSWAATVRRPRVAWPDMSRAVHRLQALETHPCRWIARPAAANVAFTAQLACVDANDRSYPSALPVATVAAACREALRAR